jgi:C_GCAxxG_C_C family probable redox protein
LTCYNGRAHPPYGKDHRKESMHASENKNTPVGSTQSIMDATATAPTPSGPDGCREGLSKRELAMSLFNGGMNCAQATFVAFCEETGMDRDTALRISSSFGGGIGRLREVCGAVSGAAMAAGMLYGSHDPLDQEAKAAHYAFVQDLALRFKQENGTYICRELLDLPEGPDSPTPEPRTETYYRLRPCAEYVGSAAEILAQAIQARRETPHAQS